MARPAQGDRVKLDRLRRARPKAVALPRGTVFDAKPMADLLGTQWQTLRDWIDTAPELEAKGALIRGGNGVQWQIKPLRTIDMLIAHFETRSAKQAQRNQAVRKAVGVTLAAEEDEASFVETKQMVEMTIAITAARDKQGHYTPSAEVADFIEGYNRAVTNGILGVRTKADPNGNLPPSVRAAVDDYLRSVATQVHAKAAAYIEGKQRASVQQKGTR